MEGHGKLNSFAVYGFLIPPPHIQSTFSNYDWMNRSKTAA